MLEKLQTLRGDYCSAARQTSRVAAPRSGPRWRAAGPEVLESAPPLELVLRLHVLIRVSVRGRRLRTVRLSLSILHRNCYRRQAISSHKSRTNQLGRVAVTACLHRPAQRMPAVNILQYTVPPDRAGLPPACLHSVAKGGRTDSVSVWSWLPSHKPLPDSAHIGPSHYAG